MEVNTPLHYAAKMNKVEVAKFLIDTIPYYPFVANYVNETPLHWALIFGSDITALYLITKMFML